MLHTRQQGTRHATFPLSRQYPTGHNHNRFSTLRGHWYADVFFSKTTSCHQEKDCLIVYNTDFVFVRPLISVKEELETGGREFATFCGMPEMLTTDGAQYFIGPRSKWKKFF